VEAKRMHELDVMKLRFFTNITHEFRTPLTLIIGPIENLIKSVREEYLQTQLKLIKRNAERLLRLINQLMDFRKLETGGLKLEASKIEIIGFIKEIANSFSLEAKERGIDFKVTGKEKEIDVWFDPDKLDKVMYNLIANAFKFTPDKGKVMVFIAKKLANSMNGEINENNVEIIVEDAGIGISNEDLPFVFEKYYQANTPNKNIGTGIGLALTKEMVELHKGNISVESTFGKGSKFIITMPVGSDHLESFQLTDNGIKISSEVPVIKEENTIAEKFDLLDAIDIQSNEKLPILLVVEDNSDLRLYIKNELTTLFNIIEANNGLKGFDKAISYIPDIIISDVMMPEMNGIELCGKLKNDERTSHIPIILLTARISESQVLEGIETGADDYITKPFSTALLRGRVQNLIKSRRLLRNQFQKQPHFNSSVVSPTTIDQKFMLKAIEIINKNISDTEFDAFQFASEIGMSRSQLYRKLNALTGFSVNELIRNCRLKKAAELLVSKNYNVTETASAVGFNDLTYFIRCFSKYYGVTPSKYTISQDSQKR
jgi:DNA-binding response OmpR family regulator